MAEPQETKKRADEAWKAQVEAEKQAQQPRSSRQSAAADEDPPLPRPSFLSHLASLVAQAYVALGMTVDPLSGQRRFRPNLARHLIDTLAMLEEKTRGNLTPEETRELQTALYQLRMAFVQLSKERPPGPESGEKSSPIVTP